MGKNKRYYRDNKKTDKPTDQPAEQQDNRQQENKQRSPQPKNTRKPAPKAADRDEERVKTVEQTAPVDDDFEEETPEELERDIQNYLAEKKQKREKKQAEAKFREMDADHTQVENLDEYLDADIRTGISKETEKLSANPFLTRGVSDLPNPEETNCRAYSAEACKLSTYDWMSKLDITTDYLECPYAEVRFKNSHKDFFILPQEGVFHVGDIVAVEASPGHDIGIISMLGKNVYRQMAHKHVKESDVKKKLYRTARYADIDKWISTVKQEHTTMLSSRYIAWDLGLKMKVNDVEYQGDGTKAIFYYSAEDRVDFRELIKILAEQFRIRIEMRQIGVRQEAGRLGGIGTCGRELCCSSWLTNFQSVSTATARTQQLSLNPQKLAGMCGKLKCCLNFEQSTYLEEIKQFPHPNVQLRSKKGKGIYNKIDIFKKVVWYNYAGDNGNIFAIPLDKVNEIIEMNKKNKFPETLEEFAVVNQKKENETNYSLDDLKGIEDK